MSPTILHTQFGDRKPDHTGKVREMYDFGDHHQLMIATDRISAFDVVLPDGIPGKGKVLTALSVFWFDYLRDVVPNHFVLADFAKPDNLVRSLGETFGLMAEAFNQGYSFMQLIEMVGEGKLGTNPTIQQQFHLMRCELEGGITPEQALINLCKRLPIPDIRLFADTIILQRMIGGSLREHLEDLSQCLLMRCDNAEQLVGRSMVVRKARVVPIECVVRGYLAGSGWKDYSATGAVCGVELPAGLLESDRLEEPIFTPATKAEQGLHDENISFEDACRLVGDSTMQFLRHTSLALYNKAVARALENSIIIADTKFEFGFDSNGRIILIDEVLTPDSSRFWDAELWQPGRPQDSFDKQYVRDYLESLGWNKQPPAPALPLDVVERTTQKYREAYRRIVGSEIQL